jgi:hypothetical protein
LVAQCRAETRLYEKHRGSARTASTQNNEEVVAQSCFSRSAALRRASQSLVHRGSHGPTKQPRLTEPLPRFATRDVNGVESLGSSSKGAARELIWIPRLFESRVQRTGKKTLPARSASLRPATQGRVGATGVTHPCLRRSHPRDAAAELERKASATSPSGTGMW